MTAESAWIPHGPSGPLNELEQACAASLTIWTVWWDLPDKSWEALCVGLDAAEQLLAELRQNHLLQTWGKIRAAEPQNLMAWYVAKTRGAHASSLEDSRRTVREVLRRQNVRERKPLVIRTW